MNANIIGFGTIHGETPDLQTQAMRYAHDLSRLYTTSKAQHRKVDNLNKQLFKYAADLNTTISDLRRKNRELQDAYYDTINRLVAASEYRDEDTGAHIVRIGKFSACLAKKLGLGRDDVQNILCASPMHDVGKIGIPDIILHKPGKLTAAEFDLIKTHTTIGAGILADAKAPVLQLAYEIALTHHEKWDGSGYPRGLAAEAIPLAGRIVGLVDMFDALTSVRPYKDAYPVDVAVAIMARESGKTLDPSLVALFREHVAEIVEIKKTFPDTLDIGKKKFVLSERDRAHQEIPGFKDSGEG
ncbi:MAG TPA: HD domain-containing phosphohydrolase [Chitinivibrionales bacterium]|nr:HD domain-containing phosphohydrolase [Chitinivibrionales bacterium]